MNCTACRLCQTRKRIVNVNGPASARFILITDVPTKVDETLGKIFSGEEFKFFELMLSEVCQILDIVPMSFYIVPILRCRPTDKVKGKTREPDFTEILACTPNVMHELAKTNPRQIFLDGKLVDRFYKKEFPDAITLPSIKFLVEQGGTASAWYKTTQRLLIEGVKK